MYKTKTNQPTKTKKQKQSITHTDLYPFLLGAVWFGHAYEDWKLREIGFTYLATCGHL